MFVINVRASTVSYDPKGKKPDGSPGLATFYVADKADVKVLPTSDLIDIFNAVAKSDPELKIREVERFATRATAEERTWGVLVRIRALSEEEPGSTDSPPAPKKTAPKKATKAKKAAGSGSGKKTWKDVLVPKGRKQYAPREGSAQALALSLISRESGISIDDWIEKMNETRTRGKWHYGNAWSGLVYLLHKVHGYGVERRNNRFYLAP